MKIIAIRIRNLASLEGDTEISFDQEPLRTAGIFAITGPTGAGKSTILDALCLALYAKTPRYKHAETGVQVQDGANSTISQNDVRGILRDGTGEGFAEVDFRSVDGQSYRARWVVRRSRGKTDGKLQDYEMALKNLSTGQDLPGRKTELLEKIEQLVGLSFEQFTRSVLLAQGDFTAFLKSAKDEKAALLEKLTGTDIYSKISEGVFKKYGEQKEVLIDLQKSLNGIAVLSDDERAVIEQELENLKNALPLKEQQLKALDKELAWHTQWRILSDKLLQAANDHDGAVAAQAAAADRTAALERIRSVQSIRTTVDALDHAMDQHRQAQEKFADLQQQEASLQSTLQELTQKVSKAEQLFRNEEQATDAAKPLLLQARDLDSQLKGLEEQERQLDRDWMEAVKAESEHTNRIGGVSRLYEEADAQVKQLEAWFTDNEKRRSVAEQETFIYARLDAAAGWLKDVREAEGLQQQLRKEKETQHSELLKLEGERKQLQEQLDALVIQLQTLRDSQSAVDVDALRQEAQQLEAVVEDLQGAWQVWTQLYASKTAFQQIQQQQEVMQNLLEKATQNKAELDKTMPDLKERVLEAQQKLDLAKLAVTSDVGRMRSLLKDEDPCPVCGSTHHPFVAKNEPLAELEQTLQDAFDKVNDTYLDARTQLVACTQQIDEATNALLLLKPQLETKRAMLESEEHAWAVFLCRPSAERIREADRVGWFDTEVKAKKDDLTKLKGSIDAVQRAQGELTELERKQNQWQLDITRKDSAVQELTTKLLQQQEKLESCKQLQDRTQAQLEQMKEELQPMFSSDQWYDNWRKDPAVFRENVRSFAASWRDKTNALQDSRLQLVNQQTLLESLTGQSDGISAEVTKRKEKLNAVTLQLGEVRAHRLILFDGAPADEVENKLEDRLKAARKYAEDSKLERSEAEKKVNELGGQQVQLQKQLQSLQQQTERQRTRLNEWLAALPHPLLEDQLRQYLSYSNDWIGTETRALQQLSDQVTRMETLLGQTRRELEAHEQQRPGDRSEQELMQARKEMSDEYDREKERIAEKNVQLKNDEENRSRVGGIRVQIDAQSVITDRWAKLNEVIGSADGKKFRQIAQEYTLDVLLGYANVHLQMLSRRYVLERIPGTLGLQVRDQDMGDEVRTVFSLSGGESFLVSLALALGLASLSSSQMNVESLFIDEGFGSLDPDTLNIAMDALERLHSQGRKVGVISHVQEMTERIPVQIRVSRRQSGKSKVEVIRS